MNRDPLKVQLIWNMQLMQIMKNFVMMNNHSVALNVTRNLQLNSDTLWMCNLMNPTMKQLVTWTTIQQLVTRNLQIEPLCKNSGSPQPRGGRGGRPVLHRTGSHGGSLLNKFLKLGGAMAPPAPPAADPLDFIMPNNNSFMKYALQSLPGIADVGVPHGAGDSPPRAPPRCLEGSGKSFKLLILLCLTISFLWNVV